MYDESPPWQPSGHARRRALWVLAAMAVAAVVLVGLLALVIHTKGSTPHAQVPIVITSSTLNQPKTTAPPRTSSTPAPVSTAASSTPNGTCAAGATCTLTGDGGLLAAVNQFRTSHSLPAVSGALTPAAQSCAVSQGDSGSCATSYFWEPVPTQSGASVVAKIVAKSDGVSFLLDPTLKSVAIGWAHAGQLWECALLKAS